MKRSTLVWLALGTSMLAGCSVKSSGLGAARPSGSSGQSGTGGRPNAGDAATGGLGLDGGQADAGSVALDTGGGTLPVEPGGAAGWDGGQAGDGPVGQDGPVGAGGAGGGGGARGGGGAFATGGAPGVGGGGAPDGARMGTGGGASLGGAAGTGGALATDAAADAPALSLGDAAEEAGRDTGLDAASDEGAPDAMAPDDASVLHDARDARIVGDGRRDTVGVDVDSPAPVWSDEFNAPANTGIDSSKWSYVTWLPGQVNNEKQRYTSSLANVFHDGEGHLVLRALYSPNAAYPYTSGRIDTNHKESFGPGHRVEVRAKLPAGAGSFPGIVMMGTSGSWPSCGQLTLMEQYGQNKSICYSAVYAGSAEGAGSVENTAYAFPDATSASTEFHVYSLDWYFDHVELRVDGEEVLRSEYATTSPLYNITEYLILDVALGGNMGGAIDNSAFPMDMAIDYIRVYVL